MRFLEERRQVLAAAREISQSGMVMGTWGNVSMRCPEPELMLITPSGVDYQLMSMEDMVLLDSSYRIREGSYKPSIETPLHMEIYRNREGVKAIVHVHSIYASSFAVARKSIPVILEETAQVVGHEVPVAEYALCGTQALATAVLEFIKPHQAGRFQTILIRGNDFEKNNIYNNNTLYAKLGGESSFCYRGICG
jgi:ribulose-5-phosphate 4-epimerase/fuculose-1-phosphate aldolase